MLARTLQLLGPAQRTAPPDGELGWLCVASAFSTYALCVGVQYCTGIFLSALLLDADIVQGAGRAEVTWCASLMSSMFLFGSLPAGLLLPRVGARAVMCLGCALFVGGCLLAATATSLATVRAGFFLLGLGCSLPSSVVLTEVQRWFSRLRGTSSGLVVAGSGVGSVVLSPLVQAQIDAGGWRQGLRFLAALAVALLPLCAAATVPIALPTDAGGGEAAALAAARREEAAAEAAALQEWGGTGYAAAEATAAPAEPPPPEPERRHTLFTLLRHQQLMCLCAYVALYGGAWFVLINNLNNSVRESGTSADAAALMVSGQGAANTVGRLLMGFAADHLAKRGVSKLMLLQASVGVNGVATALLAFPALLGAQPYQAFYYLVNGGFGGSIVSLQAPIVVDLVGINSLPPAFGLLHAVQAPLVLVMPPAYGALRAAAGWPTVWALVGAQILVAISCVGLMQGPVKGGGPFTVGKVLGACCCGRRGASAANEPL
jgi:predicted MFS family arabinose efflux permease